MSEIESDSGSGPGSGPGSGIDESMSAIHTHVEQLAHLSKHMYTRAVRVYHAVENPDLDIWTQSFKLDERAIPWAKKHMIGSKCSLWQIHETLLSDAKKEGRVSNGKVRLTSEEASLLDLSNDSHHSVWKVLSKLPRFFLQ